MSKPILVGYDPRRIDRAPVEFGVEMAKVTGAPLIVACVESNLPAIPVSAEGETLEYPVASPDPDLMADCTDVVLQVESDLRPLGIEVDGARLQGTSAAKALQQAAEDHEAGLLAVGSSRRSGPGRVLAGSTAERLLHGAPCPVAVVPRDWSGQPRPSTIGVGYDGEEESTEALRGAHALARRAGATLRVITAVKFSPSMYLETEPSVAGQTGKSLEEVEGEHRLEVERQVRRDVEALGDDVPIELDVVIRDPADVLVETSAHLDLLVCGSRGYGPMRAVLLGSVSRRVMAEGRCPVIVLPRGVKQSLQALLAEGAAARA